MPTTYAHDLFGKTVYQKLDGELQEIIRQHKMAYTVGLHGPDILFYMRPFQKNHINEMGQQMHKEEAAGFFERGKQVYRETGDEGVLAYLFGFLCHFMLDSSCHPYIGRYMAQTGASHAEIETELDRALMEATGRNPFFYHPSHVIRPTGDCVHSISLVLDGLTEKEIRHMLRSMRFYTSITVCPTAFKRKALLGLAKSTGIYRLVHGRIIRKYPLPVCEQSTEELLRLFKLAIPETVTLMESFYQCAQSGESLDVRFCRTYN